MRLPRLFLGRFPLRALGRNSWHAGLSPLCLEAIGLEGFPLRHHLLECVVFVSTPFKKSMKVGLAGLIVEGFLFEALGLESFLANTRVAEKTNVMHFG